MQRRARTSVVAVGLIAVLVGCGDDGPIARPARLGTPEHPRLVELEMVDIGFEPPVVDVAAGETIEFVFVNHGKLRHEAVFGDRATQEEHEVEMQAMGDEMQAMGDDHDEMATDEMATDDNHDEMATDDNHGEMATDDAHDEMATDDNHGEGVVAVAVEPGDVTTVTMSFDHPGDLLIGCHESGHWAAGMRAEVRIA